MKVSKIHALTENEKPAAQHRGHLFIVSAPSGGGKTTLCNAIMGLVPARGGSVRYAGEELTGNKIRIPVLMMTKD